jgi:pimeloyl-ACP methyl ester carboxylesterase
MVPFDFVGNSLGARIAIAYGGEHGETLRRLVLSEAGPEVPRSGALAVRGRHERKLRKHGFHNRAAALADVREMHPSWQPFWYRVYVNTMYRRNWAGMLVEKSDPELYWLTSRAVLKEVPYLWRMARRIPVPTLLIWGRQSDLVTADLVERMRAAIKKLEVAQFDAGHYVQREDPWGYARAISSFLSAAP